MDSHRRQLFIMSDSGKPIFTRHGSETDLAPLFGVMQALASVVANDNAADSLRSITAGSTRIAFLARRPLLLVMVARDESEEQMLLQLRVIGDAIVSFVTQSKLERIFESRQNYDFRRILAGTERQLNRLTDWMSSDLCFLLDSIHLLPMPSSLRDQTSSALAVHCAKVKNLVFGLLISRRRLVAHARLRRYSLGNIDLMLLMNVLDTSELSLQTVESWLPICLPGFDSGGFLHAYVTYLASSSISIVLLSTDPDSFYELSSCRKQLVERLESGGQLAKLVAASEAKADVHAIADVRHFIYKFSSSSHLFQPASMALPYDASGAETLRLYRFLMQKLHPGGVATKSAEAAASGGVDSSNPISIYTTSTHLAVAWSHQSPRFELLALLEPMSKVDVAQVVERVIKLARREEDRYASRSWPDY